MCLQDFSVVYIQQIHLQYFLSHTDVDLPISVVYIQQIHLYVFLSHTDVGVAVCQSVLSTLDKLF